MRDFAAWLAEWHDSVYVPGVSVALREQLSENLTFVRADLFLGLHMPGPAATELATLEAAFASDPRMLDVLIGYYERNGQHRRAIRFAERILSVSPADGLSDAPAYLRKRICPTHWRDTIVRECGERGVDPGLVFSLIRQESLFETDARSGPGARGLTQIMPPTAHWIAKRLGYRNFEMSRLRNPETNIEFGVYYLALQLEDFDGDVFRALAAYNGGPGNVARWWEFGGTGDPDVFFEDIGFQETREYVERVYRYYQIYREIYGGFTE
jgi:soluble lytic murein transglycosylase